MHEGGASQSDNHASSQASQDFDYSQLDKDIGKLMNSNTSHSSSSTSDSSSPDSYNRADESQRQVVDSDDQSSRPRGFAMDVIRPVQHSTPSSSEHYNEPDEPKSTTDNERLSKKVIGGSRPRLVSDIVAAVRDEAGSIYEGVAEMESQIESSGEDGSFSDDNEPKNVMEFEYDDRSNLASDKIDYDSYADSNNGEVEADNELEDELHDSPYLPSIDDRVEPGLYEATPDTFSETWQSHPSEDERDQLAEDEDVQSIEEVQKSSDTTVQDEHNSELAQDAWNNTAETVEDITNFDPLNSQTGIGLTDEPESNQDVDEAIDTKDSDTAWSTSKSESISSSYFSQENYLSGALPANNLIKPKAEEGEDNKSARSVFDTSEYHAALKPPVKESRPSHHKIIPFLVTTNIVTLVALICYIVFS